MCFGSFFRTLQNVGSQLCFRFFLINCKVNIQDKATDHHCSTIEVRGDAGSRGDGVGDSGGGSLSHLDPGGRKVQSATSHLESNRKCSVVDGFAMMICRGSCHIGCALKE